MAYRRKQQLGKVSTFKEETHNPHPALGDGRDDTSLQSSSSLAAKAIRASSAHRDSSLSSAYGQSALSSPRDSIPFRSPTTSSKDSSTYGFNSLKSPNETKQGFWGVLARKAKSIIDEDNEVSPREIPGKAGFQYEKKQQSGERHPKAEIQKGIGAIASSLNYIGGTIGNALEEGLTAVENRTADILQETRKLQMSRKGNKFPPQNEVSSLVGAHQQSTVQNIQSQKQADLEIQLKASRDVAMAMAAKAKLLLRELKTVKADLAFAKERCAQLEEENKILRESHEKGDHAEDDDLIRLQLETLLAEKARLAQENSVFARENRFLREIVEYHQLTMQDVVYLDESSEEVTEVYPVRVHSVPNLQSLDLSPTLEVSSPSPSSSYDGKTQFIKDDQIYGSVSVDPQGNSPSVIPLSSYIPLPEEPERS